MGHLQRRLDLGGSDCGPVVEGDPKAKIVAVRYWDGRAAPDEIRRAIDEAGFPVG